MRSLATFLVCHSAVVANESINARLRLSLLYRLLKDPADQFIPASEVNLKISEIFPKAARFCEACAFLIVNSIIVSSLACMMIYYAWREALIGFVGLGLTGVGSFN
jgi:hypothetical protein